MTTWFTADPHIGHRNIIKYCDRPFQDTRYGEDDNRRYLVTEMDKTILRRWNETVSPDDDVYILGDLAYCCRYHYAVRIVSQMNGRKFLVPGNHDDELGLMMGGLLTILPLIHEVTIQGQEIVLSHYSIREWHHAPRGVWHLFGHTHTLLPPFGKSFDVGMDAWDFRPVSFEQVREKMDKLPLGPHPKFGKYDPKTGSKHVRELV